MSLVDTPRVVHDDEYLATVLWRSTIFSIWRDQPVSRASCAIATKQMLDFALGSPLPIGIVVLLHPDVKTPSAEIRKDMELAAPRIATNTACRATIHSGTGFTAAAVRGVMTALQLVARTSRPEKVFSNDHDATEWLAPHLRKAGMQLESSAELRAAFEWVRRNVKT